MRVAVIFGGVPNSGWQGFLLGKGAVHLVLQQSGQLAPQLLGRRAERIARPLQVDGYNAFDAAGAGGKHRHPVRQSKSPRQYGG